jgi:hypothetical protein
LLRRNFRTILVLLILAATAVAFVVTEDLKLEPDPIATPKIDRTFSPICRCDQQTARIAFRLKEPDTLTLTIADPAGNDVRTLLRDAKFQPGAHQFGWDGRDDAGKVVPEGRYEATHVSRRVISPDSDGRGDAITIRFQASEPAHALLLVNGKRRAFTRLRGQGAIRWAPKRFRAGLQRLQLAAVDAAGNRGAGKPFYVQVRYLQISPTRLRVRPRRVFTVRISTDFPRYTWRLGRRSGTGRAHNLELRAPATPGRYTLTVTADGRKATASIRVRRR